MKTTQLAAYIAEKNVRLYIGTNRPLLPLLPIGQGRRRMDEGWFAFNLVAIEEASGDAQLMVNKGLGALGFFPMTSVPDLMDEGWEPVTFDGYGELESWKEVGL
jgi:hypothetical protein